MTDRGKAEETLEQLREKLLLVKWRLAVEPRAVLVFSLLSALFAWFH